MAGLFLFANSFHYFSLVKIVEQSKVPVFLAGGLNQENIRQAIEQVQPFGVDICSGVRTNRQLDPQKLVLFLSASLISNYLNI
ncbi:MAG TPA: hypothetical protein DEG92_02480 [Rikenellaceae bacterium]|nr:hypothetical protein [Rikenellaceae bacterium]